MLSRLKETRPAFSGIALVALLCLGVTFCSAGVISSGHSATMSAESLAIGGSSCSDFMDGAAVGFAVGTLFGCLWCAGAAVAAKAIALFC